MLLSIAINFKCKLTSSNKKIESLKSNIRSLSNSPKAEKMKSRSAIEQLLLVTTTQTNELIASCQNQFNKLQSNHNNSFCKLLCDSDTQNATIKFPSSKQQRPTTNICPNWNESIKFLSLTSRINTTRQYQVYLQKAMERYSLNGCGNIIPVF